MLQLNLTNDRKNLNLAVACLIHEMWNFARRCSKPLPREKLLAELIDISFNIGGISHDQASEIIVMMVDYEMLIPKRKGWVFNRAFQPLRNDTWWYGHPDFECRNR